MLFRSGVKRSVIFTCPTSRPTGLLKPGVLMELGTRGGAIPYRRLPIQSLIAEHAEIVGLPIDFDEAAPIRASQGDQRRQTLTARHYYDIDRLLRDEAIFHELTNSEIDVLAREVTQHSKAAGLPTAERPAEGFSASPAWNPTTRIAKEAYTNVVERLIWPGAPTSTFAACCYLVNILAGSL